MRKTQAPDMTLATFRDAAEALASGDPKPKPSAIHVSFRFTDVSGRERKPRVRRLSQIYKDAATHRELCPETDDIALHDIAIRDESGHRILVQNPVSFERFLAISREYFEFRPLPHLKATCIQWDTDGDEEAAASLPDEIVLPPGMTDPDEISDYISDETGFCHDGFVIEKA